MGTDPTRPSPGRDITATGRRALVTPARGARVRAWLRAHRPSRSPATLLVFGFAAAILVGALLLRLPWAQGPAGPVGFLDCLFTSTSAVCVTGLASVDTAVAWSVFGKVVIVLLIQIGGLGVMTFAAIAFQMLGARMSLSSQSALQDSFYQKDVAAAFRHSFRRILQLTLAIELAGAIALFLFLLPHETPGAAVGSALFHAISAFCNAGFSLYSDNLVGLRGARGILVTIMLLIVAGGIGFVVLEELWGGARRLVTREARPSLRTLSLHSQVALGVSALLVVVGTVALVAYGLTGQEPDWSEKLWGALFQSVSARTAGFNSIDIGGLPQASLFALVLLMFVGGSPGSCAGGVKTTSVVIWWAQARAWLRGREQIVFAGRQLSTELVGRAAFLLTLSLVWNVVGLLVLLGTETRPDVRFIDIFFEQISAFGTVGLSTGLTLKLSALGKLWIVATMYVGRLGPVTIAMWVVTDKRVQVQYPPGKLMVG